MTDASNQNRDASPWPPRRWFPLLLVVVILLHAAGLSSNWRFQRDSALYMGLGRSLAQNGTYSFNGRAHVLALPGFPAMLAVVYATLGQNFLAMNALVSVLGIGCVVMGYLLFRELSLTAFQTFACVLLLALSRTLYYYSSLLMTDVPFALLVITTLYLGLRMLRADGSARWAWCLAAAVAATAACAVRPLGPALFAALIGALWMQPGALKKWRANAAMTVALAGPVVALGLLWVLRGVSHGAPLGGTYFQRFVASRGIAGVARHVLARAPEIVNSLSDTVLGTNLSLPVSVILGVIIVLGLVRAARSGERLLCIFGVVYFGAICLSGPGRRYMLPALPALIYWLVLGAGEAASFLQRRHGMSPSRLLRAGQVLLALGVLANLVHLSKTVYEARSPNFYAITENGRMLDYFPLMKWLQANAGRDDRVLAFEDNVIHYFSGISTVRFSEKPQALHLRYQEWTISRQAVTYMVIDPARADLNRSLKKLLAARPDAFERVRDFGKLELYRVHADKV